ncbi:hypothetical protein [Chitinasiproducens palmae]|uniref:Uncharacterized protein n=1 Tax=Chitinasiproducens palmae TaxID=1770053 RepID=A0A1H2PR19_9BURK|nr:hypothetical protein [Chitinasiproducens palmae]SDV49226.1 hypothetical protein SAMN05216551_107166 [Chitinasiproducens palmae]
MTARAKHRNEVKTRLKDSTYDAMQIYKEVYGIESDSAALARLADVMLLGVVGILPGAVTGVSANSSQNVPQVR